MGGDMEHTHLVKGLDFALLQKVCLLKMAIYVELCVCVRDYVSKMFLRCTCPKVFVHAQVRAEITSKEREEEDMIEKVQKEVK